MAANTDKIRKTAPNFATTLAGDINDSVTTVPLSDTTGLPTDTAITIYVFEVNSNNVITSNTKEAIRGVVSGTNLTNCVRGVEGTAQAHASGDAVSLYVTATDWNDKADAILEHSNQDGTLKDDAVTAGVAAADAIRARDIDFSTVTIAHTDDTDGNFLNTTNTYATVTGMTTAATIPSGVTKVKISASGPALNVNASSAGVYMYIQIIDEANTVIREVEVRNLNTGALVLPFSIWGIQTVTPGDSKTYRIQIRNSVNPGSCQLYGGGRDLTVEAIG